MRQTGRHAVPTGERRWIAAAALLAVGEAVAWAVADDLGAEGVVVLALLALATTVPVALFRTAAAAAAVCGASLLVSLGLFETFTVAGLVVAVVALHRFGRSRTEPAAAALALPFLALALAGPDDVPQAPTMVMAALAPAAILAGMVAQARSQATADRSARDALAGSLVEHVARGERARIARELHDVVAHHISMIAVEAETARLTTPDLPPAGAQRLSTIGATARTALTEMRRLLGVLREDTEAPPAALDLEPQPDLRQLNDLVDRARDASGTAARLILRGAPVALDPAVELAAYRIVQEALTNARRHAPGAAVDVELHYTDDGLDVRIRDNGPGPPAAAGAGRAGARGHGLLGMRERAVAVGGELQTSSAPGNGFVVTASLPGKGQEER